MHLLSCYRNYSRFAVQLCMPLYARIHTKFKAFVLMNITDFRKIYFRRNFSVLYIYIIENELLILTHTLFCILYDKNQPGEYD